MNRKLMFRALVTFLTVAMLAVVLNSWIWGYGWHLEYSISRYVGLETWSAVMFALVNVATMIFMLYYLFQVGEAWQMPRWYYYLVVVMAAALIGLSACPVGYFDAPGAVYASSLPSKIHEISSRTMFAMMLAVAAILAWSKRTATGAKVWCIIFVLYGLLCIYGYFSHAQWFAAVLLMLESRYLVGFIVLCL